MPQPPSSLDEKLKWAFAHTHAPFEVARIVAEVLHELEGWFEAYVEAANEHVPEKLEGCGIQAFRDYAVRAAVLPSGTSRRISVEDGRIEVRELTAEEAEQARLAVERFKTGG